MGHIAFECVPHRNVICDKERIEVRGLCQRSQFAVILEVKYLRLRSMGMSPRHPMVALRIEEKCAQYHVLPIHIFSMACWRLCVVAASAASLRCEIRHNSRGIATIVQTSLSRGRSGSRHCRLC